MKRHAATDRTASPAFTGAIGIAMTNFFLCAWKKDDRR
jgi:hypothetical protein